MFWLFVSLLRNVIYVIYDNIFKFLNCIMIMGVQFKVFPENYVLFTINRILHPKAPLKIFLKDVKEVVWWKIKTLK